MSLIKELVPGVLVTGRISLDDLQPIARRGVRTIVNNRPDGEEPGQPDAADMRRAAQALGLHYVHAPIQGMPGPAQAADMVTALNSDGPILLHCKSGLRSAAAWALAMWSSGRMSRDEIVAAGAGAGFDLSGLPL